MLEFIQNMMAKMYIPVNMYDKVCINNDTYNTQYKNLHTVKLLNFRTPIKNAVIQLKFSHYETCPCNIFSEEKCENFIGKNFIFIIFSLKTYIVGTR